MGRNVILGKSGEMVEKLLQQSHMVAVMSGSLDRLVERCTKSEAFDPYVNPYLQMDELYFLAKRYKGEVLL